ncbi:MAG: efflux transporter outer membrane subunit [Acidobacteria bacterium]|nr:efflux transporter outer membrane subunit [Acidobacteriota bacterium]
MKKAHAAGCAALTLLLGVCGGCRVVGPNYTPVRVVTPPEWPSVEAAGGAGARSAQAAALAEWWTTLGDPVLDGLVERAAGGNRDLRIALTRIRQSRAALGAAEKQRDPSLTGSATYRRSQSGIPTPAERDPALFTSGSDFYDIGFDAAWEIDLFGKKHRSLEAAAAELEASEEGYRSVLVSLVAETASHYVRLRTFQKQLDIVFRNLELQERVLAVLEEQAAVGLISRLQVEQSRYTIESTRSRIPGYRIGIEETMNGLAILLGEMPGDLHGALSAPGPIPVPGIEIAVGVPADIVRRRPDIRNAERLLAAQTARIGVATADLYPSFTLSGFLGMTASSTKAFFADDSPTVGIAPFISLPLFNRGKIRDQIEIQSALQERALIAYESVVLDAIREVRDAIIAYGEERKRYRILEKGAAEAGAALNIAEEQFRSGLVNFINVLDAQRALLTFEETQVGSRGAITQNLVRLYKSLGGGWDPDGRGLHP